MQKTSPTTGRGQTVSERQGWEQDRDQDYVSAPSPADELEPLVRKRFQVF
jgi:hypothetical protein